MLLTILMARFNMSDKDRLKLAESPQVSAGLPAEPSHDLTKLRWRGGALDFSKPEQIDPPVESIPSQQYATPAEPQSAIKAQEVAEIQVPKGAAAVINWRLWVTGSALLLVCIIGLTIAVRTGNHTAIRSIHLELRDHDGQLEIRWDPNSDIFRRTADAKLSILDGAERLIVSLNPAQLQRGTALYARRSGRVEVRITVPQINGKIVQETATFQSGRPPDAVKTTLAAASSPQPASQPMTMTPVRESQAIAPAPPHAGDIAQVANPKRAKRSRAVADVHIAARTPIDQSGTSLPFTCSPGDSFHKSDAPPGWDTFSCGARNLWSLVKK